MGYEEIIAIGPFQNDPPRLGALLAQSLAIEELLAISDGVGTTIRIDSGEVRITEEGSFVDHLLCTGQRYAIDRPGQAIVVALTESRVALHAPRIGLPPRSVERSLPNRRARDLLYARSPLLNAIANLIPLWARSPL